MGIIQAMYMLANLSNFTPPNDKSRTERRGDQKQYEKTVINTEDLSEKSTDLHEIHGFTEIRQDIEKY